MKTMEKNKNENIEELKGKVAFYEYILDNANAYIYVNRFDGPMYYNKKTIDDLGMPPKEVREMGLVKFQEKFYHPDDYGLFEESAKYLADPNIGHALTTYRQKDKNGSWTRPMGTGKVTKRFNDGRVEEAVMLTINIADRYFNPEETEAIFKENAYLMQKLQLMELTKREIQILELIANGMTTREIYVKENISFHTVEAHRKKIMKKLELKNVAELVRFAGQCGLV